MSKAYYKGVATGILLGLGAGYVMEMFRRPRPQHTGHVNPLREREWETRQPAFVSRRDNPESAFDPARVEVSSFTRTGGAPGQRTEPEQLSMPGRPGQFVDSRRALKPSPRSIEFSRE